MLFDGCGCYGIDVFAGGSPVSIRLLGVSTAPITNAQETEHKKRPSLSIEDYVKERMLYCVLIVSLVSGSIELSLAFDMDLCFGITTHQLLHTLKC